MSTVALEARPSGRSFHAVLAWTFVIVAIVGFAPRSIAIVGGTMRNPPLVVHLHAAVMASWTALLAVQSTLSLAGRPDLHRRVGRLALVVAPAVLLMLIAVTISRQNAAFGTPAGPIVNNILFLQIRAILLFPLFVVWAWRTRRTDLQTHRRMMLMATLMLLDAAIARMGFLPGNVFPRSYLAVHLYLLALLIPAFVHDLLTLGRIHRAWLYGLALLLPWVIATELVWDTPWWRSTSARTWWERVRNAFGRTRDGRCPSRGQMTDVYNLLRPRLSSTHNKNSGRGPSMKYAVWFVRLVFAAWMIPAGAEPLRSASFRSRWARSRSVTS